MPYIEQNGRAHYMYALTQLRESIQVHGISNGELNYLMSILALFYIQRHGESYNTLADVVKAFECAKLEFYRRKVTPYEDKKIAQNGDIYA